MKILKLQFTSILFALVITPSLSAIAETSAPQVFYRCDAQCGATISGSFGQRFILVSHENAIDSDIAVSYDSLTAKCAQSVSQVQSQLKNDPRDLIAAVLVSGFSSSDSDSESNARTNSADLARGGSWLLLGSYSRARIHSSKQAERGASHSVTLNFASIESACRKTHQNPSSVGPQRVEGSPVLYE